MTTRMTVASDRRAFARLSGSKVPWLSATTPYSAHPLGLIDISDGGALIETERRVKPGEREALVLCGHQDVKVVARVLRVEIVRLQPAVVYRSAVRFLRPISVDALRLPSEHASQAAEPVRNRMSVALMTRSTDRHSCSELRERLDPHLHQLEYVRDIQMCSSIGAEPTSESIYCEIPGGASERQRFLRVSFAPGVTPTLNELQGIEVLARLAASLPTTEDD